jgi:4'-phosphopantetheinyl transferase
VGVDIEHLGRGPDVARQAEFFCDTRELQAMAAMRTARRVERLIQTWTLKEAFLKAKGVGMSIVGLSEAKYQSEGEPRPG